MNTNEALSLVRKDIEDSLQRVEKYLREEDGKRKRCGKPECPYCDNLGKAKATFGKTKPLFQDLVASLTADPAPRLAIDTHTRPQYGNYQAWILPNGHYVNVWKIGGHSLFRSDCSGSSQDRMIKIHAQKISRVIVYDREQPPTAEQMTALRDVYADALFHGYEKQYQLELSLSYDVYHPDPKFALMKEGTPF